MTAVEVRGLTMSYGPVRALRDLSFAAPSGAITAVLGRNGAGKTTALEICEGVRQADSGTVSVLGMDPRRDAGRLHARVGVMLQDGGVPTASRPREFLTLLARLYRSPQDVAELLDWVGLSDAKRPYRRLSGGQQQRVKLAAALIGRPELVFLDEPSTGLDPANRLEMWQLLSALRRDGVTVVLSTHHMDEAETLADHVVMIHEGRTVASGSVAQLVGTDAEVVSFQGPMHLPLGELQAVLPQGATITEQHPGSYRIAGTTSPQVLATVTAWCAQHGGAARDVRIGAHSLEQTFLDLTGVGAEPPASPSTTADTRGGGGPDD